MLKYAFPISLALLGIASCVSGCGKATVETPTNAVTAEDHSGWWCAEHGVPEEVCGVCSKTIAADLKAKGDWCAEHACPDSQCFVCHPEFAEKFAAQYEAKYGKAPPARTVEAGHRHEDGHDHDHAEPTA